MNLPRARLVDGFAVHLHSGSHAIEYRNLLAVDGAIGVTGDVEDEGSVLADRVDEPADDGSRRQIAAEFTSHFEKCASLA